MTALIILYIVLGACAIIGTAPKETGPYLAGAVWGAHIMSGAAGARHAAAKPDQTESGSLSALAASLDLSPSINTLPGQK